MVQPDIIVHHRTKTYDNFLVIEIKKSTNDSPDRDDEDKLRAFLSELKYEHGLFLRIGCADKAGQINRVWWAS